MSTSLQVDESFVFLEARNGERLELIRLVVHLSLLPPNAVPNLRELSV